MKFLFLLVPCVFLSCSSIQTEQLYLDELQTEYVYLADEYVSLEQYSTAVSLYIKAKTLSSNNEKTIVYKIARTASLAKEWSVAIEYYQNLLSLDENNLSVKKSIAWVYAQSGNIKNALEMYTLLYKNYAFDSEIATNYILVLLASNDVKLVETIFLEYRESFPEAENLQVLREKIESKQEKVESETTNPSEKFN